MLQELQELWKVQSPWLYDEIFREEMFPSASYQYIYYGMRGNTAVPELHMDKRVSDKKLRKAETLFMENAQLIQQLKKNLQPHRELIEKIKKHGLQKI